MHSVLSARLAKGAAAALVAAAPAAAQDLDLGALEPEYWETYGKAEIETTLFAETARHPGQRNHDLSFAIEPTIYAEWLDGDLQATFTAFGRVDAVDDERSHADIREAKLSYLTGDWTITAGIDQVFWGKTEAFHLVDIINQTDQVEDLDDEDSLGQPMLRVSRLTDVGTFTAFWLPVFRERTFPGEAGRLRSALVVDEDREEITPDGDHLAQSFALRYDGVFGEADVGLSFFHGVSRDPSFEPIDFVLTPTGPVPTALRPVYTGITQVGFDGQYTDGPTLYKGEAIFRTGQRNLLGVEEDYVAFTGGFEHTLFQVFGDEYGPELSNADLGLIGEVAWDSRGDEATVIFQQDVIVGARLALNDEADTAFLLTGAIDPEFGVGSMRLEASRRVAPGLVAEIEGQFFINADEDPLGADLQDDSFVRLKLTYFW